MMDNKRISASFILLLIFTLFYLSWMIGERPFATPDEARYVEIPREMVASADYLTPRLNGVKYFEKPPLFYWLQAGMLHFCGLTEKAMRTIPMLMATLGVMATFVFATFTINLSTGIIAALILLTAPLYFALGQMIILDMMASIWVTLSLFAFYLAFYNPNPRGRQGWFLAFSGFLGLGVLTKGLMALALPGPIIVLWLTATKNWCQLKPFYPGRALCLFVALVVPWHLMVGLKNPEFFHKYFIVEHFLRFTTTYHGRCQPWWFFIPIVLLGFLPWIALFFTRTWRQFITQPLPLFLAFWVAWVLIFFSFSHSKLIPYVLPLFPPLAILAALSLRSLAAKQIPLLLLLGGVAMGLNHSTRILAPLVQKPSLKPLLANLSLGPNDLLVSYLGYFQDLPVYSNRIVTAVDVGGELAFGIQAEDTAAWMITKPQFVDLWYSNKLVWTVMRCSDFKKFQQLHQRYWLYRQTEAYVLLVNHQVAGAE